MGLSIPKPPKPSAPPPPPPPPKVEPDVGKAMAEMGKQISEAANQAGQAMGNAAEAVGRGAEKVAEVVGNVAAQFVDTVTNKDGWLMTGKAADLMGAAAAKMPPVDLGSIRGKMSLPHVPPRPDINFSAKAGVGPASAQFGVENGGWPKLNVSLGQVKPDGSFSLKDGALGATARAFIQDTIKDVMAGGAKVGDLIGRCVTNPLLSAILSQLPQGFPLLLHQRKEVGGGFQHMAAAMMAMMQQMAMLMQMLGQLPHLPHLPNLPNLPQLPLPGGAHPPKPPIGKKEEDLGAILNNPNLSFEDKIFMFCLAMAQKQEKKITDMMDGWQKAKNAAKNSQTPGTQPGTGLQPPPDLVIPQYRGGGDIPFFSQAGSMVGELVGMAKSMGPEFLQMASSTAPKLFASLFGGGDLGAAFLPGGPGPKGTELFDDKGNLIANAADKDSENTFMQKLTHEQQMLTKMFEMCSNLTKSMHDTQMSSIRNMR